jgi:hypothetical protein
MISIRFLAERRGFLERIMPVTGRMLWSPGLGVRTGLAWRHRGI